MPAEGFARFRIARATLSAEMAKPYVYGASDCFMLGCRVADALDPALGLVALHGGAYSTLKGAHRALRRRGFQSLAELFGAHLPAIAPAQALIGDLAIVRFPDGGDHVAVSLGDRFRTKTERGASDHKVGEAIAAFATGR